MRFFTLKSKSRGQTLIETVVAIFIMVTGITAALGLAIYALDSSSNINKQIIGTGLAREGIEAIKNMRDTNWLQDKPNDPANNPPGCYDYVSGQNDATCYLHWLTQKFNITSGTYLLGFNPNPADPAKSSFALDFQQFSGSGFGGFYTPDTTNTNGTPDSNGTNYYRKIIITANSNPPYNHLDIGPELDVASQVWWTDKNCSKSPKWPGPGKCSVELDTTLTNWKDY